LGREKGELTRIVKETVQRRNDIVHRADRAQSGSDGQQQPMDYVQARQGVDTIEHVCIALDALVERRIREMRHEERGG